MPKYPGFIGGSYAGRSITAAGDRCINLFPESMSGAGSPENSYTLLSTSGHNPFATLPTFPVQLVYEEPATGRCFAIAGAHFYEVFANGTNTAYGPVDPGYYTMASNSQQIMLSCAGAATGYIFTLNVNTLIKISAVGFLGSVSVRMIDNYFLVRTALNSRQFQISAILDGTTWDAGDVALSEGGPDNLVADMDTHREYWLFGSRRAEVFVDTGAALFPFQRINSVALEVGCAAPQSVVKLDNTIYWLGQNDAGQCRVYMNNGYVPIGVSTRAVEYFFNEYAKNGGVSDAVSFGYQDESGHSFYVISFPSATSEISSTGGLQSGVVAGATWVYDVTEKLWHERQSNNPLTGQVGRSLSAYHAFVFGKHLVGGGDSTGKLYDLSVDTFTDNGVSINRIRRAPHVVDELKWIFYNALRLSVQVGGSPGGFANLRVSNDGGLTWGNYYQKSLGNTGQYQTVVEWRQLGRSMRRSFEVSITVNGPVVLVDAFLAIQEGTR